MFDARTMDKLRKELPPIFGRTAVSMLLPGVICPKTLANLAALGDGPKYQMIRRRCTYERDSFLEWLQEQVR